MEDMAITQQNGTVTERDAFFQSGRMEPAETTDRRKDMHKTA